MAVDLFLGWIRIVLASIGGPLIAATVLSDHVRTLRVVLVGLGVGTLLWMVWAFRYWRATTRQAQGG